MRCPPLHTWLFVTLAAAPLVVGCGGAAKSGAPAAAPAPAPAEAKDGGGPSSVGAAPAQQETEALATLPDAERALAVAAAELDQAFAPSPEASSAPSGSGAGSEKHRAPAAAPAGPLAGNACRTACPALASLRRAAAAVCRLTSEQDARCTTARATVARNEQRTAPCSCPHEP